MTLTEAYTLLFIDSFTVMLFVPLKSIFIFEVMKIFGTYNPYLMCAVASFGMSVAAAANWLLGLATKKALNFEAESIKSIKLINFLNKYGSLILLLSVIPYAGSLITAGYGAIGGRFAKVIPVVFIAHVIYFYVFYTYL